MAVKYKVGPSSRPQSVRNHCFLSRILRFWVPFLRHPLPEGRLQVKESCEKCQQFRLCAAGFFLFQNMLLLLRPTRMKALSYGQHKWKRYESRPCRDIARSVVLTLWCLPADASGCSLHRQLSFLLLVLNIITQLILYSDVFNCVLCSPAVGREAPGSGEAVRAGNKLR